MVLDEPTSSIDVFSQAQILALIQDLRRRLQLTNILISHDLGVVHELANKIAIMYLGKIVEFGPAEEIFPVWPMIPINSPRSAVKVTPWSASL